jgi:hypothetical protein
MNRSYGTLLRANLTRDKMYFEITRFMKDLNRLPLVCHSRPNPRVSLEMSLFVCLFVCLFHLRPLGV